METEQWFSSLNNYKGIEINFTLDENAVKSYLDERNVDQLGELTKIYYIICFLLYGKNLYL